MSVNEKALKIYNQLPYGAKSLTAQKLDCANFYVKELIVKITTPKEVLIKIMDAMILSAKEINKETTNKVKNMEVIYSEVSKIK